MCRCGASVSISLTIPIGSRTPRSRRTLRFEKKRVHPESRIMSETTATPSKPKAGADRRTLEHVDKWLAVIRELSGERK